MRYMGSKRRIAKHIAPIITASMDARGITTFHDVFCGGGNLVDAIPARFTRVASDINPHVIAALTAIRDHPHDLPDAVTEAEYQELLGAPPSPIESWIRFVASFGARFDGGYARAPSDYRDFVGGAKRSAIAQSPKLQGVELVVSSYDDLELAPGAAVYCDPPYRKTTGYARGEASRKRATFDHDGYYKWARRVSGRGHLVFASEYWMPDDFTCVWEGKVGSRFARHKERAPGVAVERLFTFQED